jgi:hypothetical protein
MFQFSGYIAKHAWNNGVKMHFQKINSAWDIDGVSSQQINSTAKKVN